MECDAAAAAIEGGPPGQPPAELQRLLEDCSKERSEAVQQAALEGLAAWRRQGPTEGAAGRRQHRVVVISAAASCLVRALGTADGAATPVSSSQGLATAAAALLAQLAQGKSTAVAAALAAQPGLVSALARGLAGCDALAVACARCLVRLSKERQPVVGSLLEAPGCLAALVAALRHRSGEVAQSASEALWGVSMYEEDGGMEALFCEPGALEALAALLPGPAGPAAPPADAAAGAAAALAFVTTAAAAAALTEHVAVMAKHALGALGWLAQYDTHVLLVRVPGLLDRLAACLSRSSSGGDGASAGGGPAGGQQPPARPNPRPHRQQAAGRVPEFAADVLFTMCHTDVLAHHVAAQAIAQHTGCMAALVRCLSAPHLPAAVVHPAAHTLYSLAADAAVGTLVRQEGCLDGLLGLLGSPLVHAPDPGEEVVGLLPPVGYAVAAVACAAVGRLAVHARGASRRTLLVRGQEVVAGLLGVLAADSMEVSLEAQAALQAWGQMGRGGWDEVWEGVRGALRERRALASIAVREEAVRQAERSLHAAIVGLAAERAGGGGGDGRAAGSGDGRAAPSAAGPDEQPGLKRPRHELGA